MLIMYKATREENILKKNPHISELGEIKELWSVALDQAVATRKQQLGRGKSQRTVEDLALFHRLSSTIKMSQGVVKYKICATNSCTISILKCFQ